jgi:acyl-CoA synthetase (AMP-forming)/AMP-acid ligase II
VVLLRDYLRRNTMAWPEREAYVSTTARLTWGEVTDRTWRLASLLRRLGVAKGDVIASMSVDTHEMVETWFAACTIGAIRTAINPRLSPQSAAHILRDAGVKVLLVQGGECEESFRKATENVPDDVTHVIGFGEHNFELDYESLLAEQDPLSPADWPEVDPSDRVAISYTSGTTGMPKGVVTSQGAVVSACLNTWFQAGYQPDDVFLHCLPASGTNILVATGNVFNGAKVVLTGRFSAENALRLIQDEGVTTTLLVPTMMLDILDSPAFEPENVESLRLVMYGAAPATPVLIRRALKEFGCQLQQWYGSTEATGGWTTLLHHRDHLYAIEHDPEILTSVGRPMLHVEVAILDEDGREVPRGQIGTVAMRSETLMEGYLNLPNETAEVLKDGWLYMGDLGRIDERGYLYIVDRKSFVIVTGGYNVYPIAVENVLAEHPKVKEVCVVGIPDERWGEIICAVVIPEAAVEADELIEHCRPRLSFYEVPRRVEFVDQLPRGPTGKVLKSKVRDQIQTETGSPP